VPDRPNPDEFVVRMSLHRYYKHALSLECLFGMTAGLEAELGRALLTSDDNAWSPW
jgi:hypothetical protein